jgi:hypothetical protein
MGSRRGCQQVQLKKGISLRRLGSSPKQLSYERNRAAATFGATFRGQKESGAIATSNGDSSMTISNNHD